MRPRPDTAIAVPGATGAADDRAVWNRLSDGDLDALGELFDRHARAVYNYAFRRCASWSSAEEIVQSTFVTTWQRAGRGRLPALDHPSALPWLLGVALNETRNAQRLLRRVGRRVDRIGGLRDVAADHVDHADEVADRVDDERRMAEVRAALAGIPAHERETIELVLWAGLSHADAARTLGVAEGTVKSRLSRGRARLAVALAHVHQEEFR